MTCSISLCKPKAKCLQTHRLIELDHVLLELPESVGEQHRIVPSILPRSIPRTRLVKLIELPHTSVHGRKVDDARIRNHADGEVGMVVVPNDLGRVLLLIAFDRLGQVGQQVPGLGDLLLGLILGEGANHVVGLGLVVVGPGGVELGAGLGDVEVGEERSVALHSGRDIELGLDDPVLLVVAKLEALLVDQQRVLGQLLERWHGDGRRDVHGNVDLGADGPHGRDVLRDNTADGAIVEVVGAVLESWYGDLRVGDDSATLRRIGCGRLAEELLRRKLDEQEDAHALDQRPHNLDIFASAQLSTPSLGGWGDTYPRGALRLFSLAALLRHLGDCSQTRTCRDGEGDQAVGVTIRARRTASRGVLATAAVFSEVAKRWGALESVRPLRECMGSSVAAIGFARTRPCIGAFLWTRDLPKLCCRQASDSMTRA